MPDHRPSTSRREFLRTTALALAGGCMVLPACRTGATVSAGVPPKRLVRLARGANICRWFRFGEESSAYLSDYLGDAEAETIRQLGITHVRLCITPKVVMDQATGKIREENTRWVDAAIRRFHKADLLVIVDLHNEDREAELNSKWQEAFVSFWSGYATRLSQFDPEKTILEIINEPVFKNRSADWDTLNARLAGVIRAHAPQHTIMTSGADWGGIDGLQKLKLLSDPNVIYSFHCYDPFAFTHQGASWTSDDVEPLRDVPYPSSPGAVAPLLSELKSYPESERLLRGYGAARWGKAQLAARFNEALKWGKRNQVALHCGEFGVFPTHAPASSRANWFRDFGQVLAANKIGWSVWGWDEGFGLDRRYIGGKPVVDKIVAGALGLHST